MNKVTKKKLASLQAHLETLLSRIEDNKINIRRIQDELVKEQTGAAERCFRCQDAIDRVLDVIEALDAAISSLQEQGE